ncbi:uncharacterized protein LOC119167075 isoform X2 [Rhipicephalus microplus]|uniref:uncharacterized protein LOC119167075 isoform X2 n=1 Tax=Rhipicephalus microplus TaxID=6941 RepID=UPI003F6B8D6C
MASTAPTRKRRDGELSSTSSSSSSTSDSTSTTVFDVTKAVFTTTTTTTSEEDDSSRQVVQASSSEISVNVQQQGPTALGIASQTIQGPTGFNVILPMGQSVPVVFTDQGICIAGYNAPMAVTETEDEVTTTTTTTELQQQQQEQDTSVAGIFQLLPVGSYLPTFVTIDQVDDEDEECVEEEKPVEEYDEDGPAGAEEAELPAVRVVEAAVHKQKTFVHLGPLQGETAGTAAWSQPAPPLTLPPTLMMPPPMSPPMPQPMYAGMQAGQGYMPQQYGIVPPYGWQAQMMQSQDQAQIYGQAFGMPLQQPQWPPYQPFWPGMQWQTGQSQWMQGSYMPEGSQMMQQQQWNQQHPQQELMTEEFQQDIVVSRRKGQAPSRLSRKIRSVSLPCRLSLEDFASQTTSLTDVEVRSRVSPERCTVHRVPSTQTSQMLPSRCVSVKSRTHVESAGKSLVREGGIQITKGVRVSSEQHSTEGAPVAQATLGTETYPTVQELWCKEAQLGHDAAHMHAGTACGTYETQTEHAIMGPAEVKFSQQSSEPHYRHSSPLTARVCSYTHIVARQYRIGPEPPDVPEATVNVEIKKEAIEVNSKTCGVQAIQKREEPACAGSGTHFVLERAGALQPIVSVHVVRPPTVPPQIAVEVQAGGGSYEPDHLASRMHTVQQQEEPPSVALGVQAMEYQDTFAATAFNTLASDPHVALTMQTTGVSSQDMLTGQTLQAQCVSQGAKVSPVIGAYKAVLTDGTTQTSASSLRICMTEVPYLRTESQAVQTFSLESVAPMSSSVAQKISVGQQCEGSRTEMLMHSTTVSPVNDLNPLQQHGFSMLHGDVFRAPQLPVALAEKPHCNIEVQCDYQPFVQTTANITAVKVEQKYENVDGHQEAFVQCNHQPLDGATTHVMPARPSRDAEVQFGHDPVEDFAKDIQPSLQPMRDFGAQCVYEPERVVMRSAFRVQSSTMYDLEQQERKVGAATSGTMPDFAQQHDYGTVGWPEGDVYMPQEKPMQDAEQQHGYKPKNWGMKMTYGAGSMPMQDFGMQHDISVAMSPPPAAANSLYEMVDMAVGDSKPRDFADHRFPWRPMSRIQSGPSLSSCSSSVFMFGNSEVPHVVSAGTQVGEISRHRVSPAFAFSTPRLETALRPCVAVCSRNTVNHPCTLNISSHPGRLSQAAGTRDAIFQTQEPVAVRAPHRNQDFVDQDLLSVRSRSLSREPASRTPLREVAIQTFAGPQVPRTVSPSSSPSYGLGLFGMSPMSSSRCTSPGQDTAQQTDRYADVRRSPLGGPFSHDEFTGQVVEPTRSLGHDIMIQASPVAPVASSAWGPSISRPTSAAPVTEVYPCGHLPEVLQTRDVPPSPLPLSPPPRSPALCPCLASHGWAPVVVEHKVGIGGKLAQLLMLRKQQGLIPEHPDMEDKGTSEGPYVGPDGEQDYGHRGFSHAEHYSGEGDHTETCAVLGSASFVADGSTVPGTGRRSSIETTSNVTRSTKVVAMLPEVSVACFLLALLLALVASAALLSWTTRRHARLSLAAEGTKKAVHPSNVTYIIPPFSHLQTIDPSLNGKTVTLGPHTWTVTPSHGTGSNSPFIPTVTTPSSASYELCTTEFCVKEGQMLRYLLKSDTDPCKDFYKYVCDQWPSQQPPDASYTGADGALAAEIETRMHDFLDGPGMSSIQPLFTFWTNCNNRGSVPRDRILSHLRALGLELPGSRASASPERLMVLAVTLVQEFGLFALLTVELDSDPEGKAQHVVAVDEPELVWGRMKPPLVTAEDTEQWNMLLRVAQPLALLLLSDLGAVQSVTRSFARITMAMTNVSVAHRHISDRMALYEMHSYQELNRLDPLLNGLFGSSQDLRPSSRLLVKAPRFVDLVYTLLAMDREALHEYMVILALLHLAPFMDVPDASSAFLSSLTGEDVTWGTPPWWRVCLRLAERTLPNLMQVAYEQVFKGSPIFDEVMGDIMVDEVRNGLVEFIDSLSILDAWSKIIAKIKVRDTKVYTFYPIVLADLKNLNAYVKKLERSVTWDGDIMEYYIRLRGFLAQMKERDETLDFFLPRWKHSIFDPECVYYPRRDVVYVPVGFFNITVPTSPGERMFHVPRAGPRLVGCFFRVIMENTGLYKPEGLWWTEATRAAFQDDMACLEEKHNQMILQDGGINLHDVNKRLNLQGLSDVEDNVAVRISMKVFNDRLFTNRYLNRDYRLPGVEHLSSQQLFFIYLARSHCEIFTIEKKLEDIRCSYKSKGKYRTNLPLSNNHEFADAFQCPHGTEMNPTTQCSVWR